MIRVLLVDDQALIREGMRRVLDTDPNMTVVGECADGDEVVDAVHRANPDVVVMDIRMKRMDGATATAELVRVGGPPVLVLTTFDDDETVAAALRAGVAGFLLKDAPGEHILAAIAHVAAGEAWLDPRITGRVLATYRDTNPAPRSDIDITILSDRELAVLREVGRGATNQEIATELHISESTVKSHLGNLTAKLHLRDRAAAIVLAHDQQLV
jgi:DNA-binding NarL/FixJ family response regulator